MSKHYLPHVQGLRGTRISFEQPLETVTAESASRVFFCFCPSPQLHVPGSSSLLVRELMRRTLLKPHWVSDGLQKGDERTKHS